MNLLIYVCPKKIEPIHRYIYS